MALLHLGQRAASPLSHSARRFLARCGDEEVAHKLPAPMKSDRVAHAPNAIAGKATELEDFGGLMEAVLKEDVAFTVKGLEVNGRDLLEHGWVEDPELGTELQRLFDLVLTGDLPNDRTALLAAVDS